MKGAKDAGLKTIPFDCGFFITIPCQSPEKVYNELVSRKIHVIPMGNVIRVTISAISLNDCERLHYVSYPRNGKSNDEVTV